MTKLPKRLQKQAENAAKGNADIPETEIVGAPLGPSLDFDDLPVEAEDIEKALRESLGYPGIAAMKLRIPISRVIEELQKNPKLNRYKRDFQQRSLEFAEIALFKKVRAGDMGALKLLITGKHKVVQEDWNQGKEPGTGSSGGVTPETESGFSFEHAKLIAIKRFQNGSALGLGPAMPVIEAEGSTVESSYEPESGSSEREEEVLEVPE